MSQQEFSRQQQQYSEQHGSERQRTRPWFKGHQHSAMPKQEHPSSYTETPPAYSYQAQSHTRTEHKQDARSSEARFRPSGHYSWFAQLWSQYRPRTRAQWQKFVLWTVLALIFVPLLLKLLFVAISIALILVLSVLFFFLFVAAIIGGAFLLLRYKFRRYLRDNRQPFRR